MTALVMTNSRLPCLVCIALWGVLTAVSPLHGQSTGRPVVTLQERRWQADRLFDEGRYDEARDAYLPLAESFANDAEFNRDLGWAYYRARQPDVLKAIHYWTASWTIDGKEDLKVEAARAYGAIGQWQRGAKLLLDLASSHPQHPEHWRQLAELAEVAAQPAQADTWYRTYLERRPTDTTARLALARLLGSSRNYTEAIAQFSEVLQTTPRSTVARLGIAQVLAWKGDYEESLRRYDALLREQPANVDALKGKAFALLWSGKPEAAKPLFQQVARRRPSDREVRTALAGIARLESKSTAPATAGAPPAALAAPGSARAEPDVWARIDEAFARGDGKTAATLITDALVSSPGDVPLRRRLAQAYLVADDVEGAITLLQRVCAEHPDDAEARRELASAQVRGSRFGDAIDTLFAYLALRPDDRAARVDVARVSSWTRRFDVATREYERVLQADPNNVESLVGLAQVQAWQGNFAQALTQFEAVLARQPAQREALIGAAQCLFWMGSRTAALEAMARLQQQFPDDTEIAKLAADLRESDRQQTLAAMDTDTAIRYYEGLLAEHPRDADLLQKVGDLFARKGDFDGATTYYRRVHELRPDDVSAQLALARTLTATKAYDESTALFREVIAREPTASLRLELAQVLASAREYAQAAGVYRALLSDEPDNVDAALGLARLLSWNREYDASLAEYRALLDRHPDHRDAQVEYARVHAWKGDLDRAIQLFSELEARYPDDRDVLLGKGQALQWSGRAREAYNVLAPLLAAHPKDPDIRIAMAGTQLALGRSDLALRELQVAGPAALQDADVLSMRNLALRQLRPVLVVSFTPSTDSDDLDIYPGSATVYFSAFPRVRSYVRGTLVPASLPSVGNTHGRELVAGSTVQVSPEVIARGEAGVNIGTDDRVEAIGGGGASLQPSGVLRLDVDVGRQFLNYLPLAYDNDISRVLLRAGGDYRPGWELLLHADYFHGWYSDDNRANGGNLVLTRPIVKHERLRVEAGYLFSLSGFTEQTQNGYWAPSRLLRHAGLANVYGRAKQWLGYNIAGTFGAEKIWDTPDPAFSPDGSIRFTLDFIVGDHFKLTTGYAYSRVTTLSRTGAYASQAVISGLEIGF